MSIIIDAHEDLAYNMITLGRDYRRSALEIRALEHDSGEPEPGQSTLGWPEFQKGQVAVVFSTLFAAPRRFASPGEKTEVYDDYNQAHKVYMNQIDFYRRWCDNNPDMFRLITNQKELKEVLDPWDQQPANFPDVTHPVGMVLLMEGADGVRSPGELELWWQVGLRTIGIAWMGARYCGATREGGTFGREGLALLDRMADMGFTLDISHMNNASALQALDHYQGPVIASHSNVRAITQGPSGDWSERQLTDDVIRLLIQRGGVMGLVPFNLFLRGDWKQQQGKAALTLDNSLAVHVDYVCQMAGNAQNVGIGTDFDGGFGAQSVPAEVDTVADLQKLGPVLANRGYTESDIAAILGGNWRRHLERNLPAA